MSNHDVTCPYCGADQRLRGLECCPDAEAAEEGRKHREKLSDDVQRIIREHVAGYEVTGQQEDGSESVYHPTQEERDMMHSCIDDLLASPEFLAAFDRLRRFAS